MSTPLQESSLGELVALATRDLSVLIRQEVALAKAEVKAEAKRAGLGAGLLGGSGFLGVFALLFVSVAIAFGIAGIGVPLGVGFLVVAFIYFLGASVLGMLGLRKVVKISPPQRTIRSVRNDLTWARHPTVAVDSELEELRATHAS